MPVKKHAEMSTIILSLIYLRILNLDLINIPITKEFIAPTYKDIKHFRNILCDISVLYLTMIKTKEKVIICVHAMLPK